MKKVIRLTESDLIRIVKRVINEQSEGDKSLTILGFEKWGNGYLLRFPKSSSPKNDVIRIQVNQQDDNYNIMILVQGNKRTRSEIKGVGIFKDIERLLNSSFKRHDSIFDKIGGYGTIDTIKQIVNKLKSLNIDVKSNSFTQGTISEQEGGQDPESTEKLVVDRDWWTLDLKPKLKAYGFVEKVDPPQHNKPCTYKCCNYMYKGNHNTGTNVMLDCYKKSMGEWQIVVYNKGDQNQRGFSTDNNGINQAIKYAINLK